MTTFLFFLMLFLMLFIIVMAIVISNNDDEFANLIKTFYECRNNNKTSDLQKSLKKYNIHYCLGDKEMNAMAKSADSAIKNIIISLPYIILLQR